MGVQFHRRYASEQGFNSVCTSVEVHTFWEVGEERLPLARFTHRHTSFGRSQHQVIHGLRGEEKTIAWNQHHVVIEGIEHPRHDAVKPLKVRWVVPNLAAEEGLSVRFAAQHNGL